MRSDGSASEEALKQTPLAGLIGLVYLLSLGVFNGCLASVAGNWSWSRWRKNVMVSAMRTFPWFIVMIASLGGGVAPFQSPEEVYGMDLFGP